MYRAYVTDALRVQANAWLREPTNLRWIDMVLDTQEDEEETRTCADIVLDILGKAGMEVEA